jgi:hypothetical protein
MDEATEILRFEELENQADQALGTIAEMTPATAAFYADEVIGTGDPEAYVALIARKVEEEYVRNGDAIPAHVASATATLRPRILHACKVAASVGTVGDGTASASKEFSGQPKADADCGLTFFQRRQLVKQLVCARFERLKDQFQTSIEIERSGLDLQAAIAKANVEIQRDTVALRIREDYLKVLADAGMRVDLTEIERMGEFGKKLEDFHERVAARRLAAAEEKKRLFAVSPCRIPIASTLRWLAFIAALLVAVIPSPLGVVLPIFFIVVYALTGARQAKTADAQEHVADEVYYVGYLATLAAFGRVLMQAVRAGVQPANLSWLTAGLATAMAATTAGLIISAILRQAAKTKVSAAQDHLGSFSAAIENLNRDGDSGGLTVTEDIAKARAALDELVRHVSAFTTALENMQATAEPLAKNIQELKETLEQFDEFLVARRSSCP